MKHTEGKIQTGFYSGIKDGVTAIMRHVSTKRKLFLAYIDTFTALEEAQANAERLELIWNAADGTTNEQAVRYLEHGAQAIEAMKLFSKKPNTLSIGKQTYVESIIANMEGK